MPLHSTLLGRSNHGLPISRRKIVRQLNLEPDLFNQARCGSSVVLYHANVIDRNSPLPTKLLHVIPSACTNRCQE